VYEGLQLFMTFHSFQIKRQLIFMLFISKILFIELNTISLIMILYFEYLF